MAKNLILPSGNNLTLGTDKNLVLQPNTYIRICRGSSSVYNEVTAKARGGYQLASPASQKNLVLPSGNNLVLGNNKNLVLPTRSYTREARGSYQIFTPVSYIKCRGEYKIVQGFITASQGYFRIGFETYDVIKDRGSYRIKNSVVQEQKGSYDIYQQMTLSKRRGSYTIFESFPPIKRRGAYRTINGFSRGLQGRHFIENESVEGYVVYIGTDEMPDFTTVAGFSATLPIDVSITPPVTGSIDLFVVVRKRNRYGLESQNQQPLIITIDSTGDEQLGDLSTPVDVYVIPSLSVNEYLRVMGSYSGFYSDRNPADTWRVYLKADTPPTPGVDAPVASGSISGGNFVVDLGPYPDGDKTYYVAVTVFRSADSEESGAGTNSLTLDADPATPVPVKSGYEVR